MSAPARFSAVAGLIDLARRRNLGGQLRVESKLGEGSKFSFVLPFRLPSEEDYRPRLTESDTSTSGTDSSRTISALGSRTATTGSTALTRSNSQGSGGSRGSSKGSIDSLISAMSSTMLGPRATVPRQVQGSINRTGHAAAKTSTSVRPQRRHSLHEARGEVEIAASNVPLRAVRIPAEQDLSPDPPSNALAPVTRPDVVRRHSSMPTKNETANGYSAQREPFSSNKVSEKEQERQRAIAANVVPTPPLKSSPTHMSEYVRPSNVNNEDQISPLRILVVEDEPINRMILQKRLKKDGHEVVCVNDGVEGVRALEADPGGWDVVLMDLLMPVRLGPAWIRPQHMTDACTLQIMGGLEATQAIRKQEQEHPLSHAQLRPSTILNGRLPILACSASLPERERSTIVDAGFGTSRLMRAQQECNY